jgi:phospholipid-binding lipoprotein MlaA
VTIMRTSRTTLLAIALAALGLLCAPAGAAENDRLDGDPIEGFNRGMFWFNDHVDTYVLVPVATAWDKVLPSRVQRSLANFFDNLRFPIVAINNVLQGKFKHAASDVGRFAVNTTVGVAGFFDPASDWGLEAHNEDFGQTLGYWGLPPGPYLVLPILGPSDVRDGAGLVPDAFMAVYPWFIDIVYTVSARAVDVVNTRSLYLKQVEEAKAASLDYYTAVRNAYIQRRRSLVNDGTARTTQESEDLYNVDTEVVE